MSYWLVVDAISLAVAFAFNLLGSIGIGPIRSVREISKKTPTTFRPANFTFLIWSVIYAGQIAFLIFSWLVTDVYVNAMSLAYPLLCFFNALWIVRFGMDRVYESCIYVFCMLSTLVYIYGRVIGLGYFYPWLEMFAVVVPWSIYLGWVIVALIVNLFAADIFAKDATLMQTKQDIIHGTAHTGTRAAVLLIYGLWFVIALFLFYFKDVFLIVAMCWGFFGIICNYDTSAKVRKTLWVTIFCTFVFVALRFVFYLFFAY